MWSRGGKMKFDELDAWMRVFETAHDLCVLPGLYMVARLDGRSFTRLTKEIHQFVVPFDARFRDLMLATAEHLMTGCGFNVIYGYSQSDEVSLLFALTENGFGRKLRKLTSVLSGGPAPGSRCCSVRWRCSIAASRNFPRWTLWSITSAGATRTPTATP